jgi:tRNA(Leu) C34 or U34 (ribose-2'-O)-methylase TrmL
MPNSQAVIIGLCNPKSPSNVGSVMRAAGCYQAHAVRYTGVRFARSAQYHTDTKDIKSKISLAHTDDLLADLPSDMQVVCIELVEGATPLPAFVHPERAIYIFGPEDGSIPQDIIDQASHVVYIPTIGCMNLAATVNVLLYDRLAKTGLDIDHEARIISSRDTNNRLKVKAAT